jgi:transcriptional regulator with XRE-family HTH domain
MSTADQLTTYGELAEVIDNLPLLVRERRRQMRLSVRSAAAQIGMSFSTVSRLENGADLNGENLAAILRWLDAPESLAGGRTGVSEGTEAHGGAGEAQEAAQ